MADNKDVVISASMSDKDLLSSIDETLKKNGKASGRFHQQVGR